MIKVGNKAPAFNLPDQFKHEQKLSDYAGKWVLLYFYPKDDTPGCTVEACSIRDNWGDFKDAGLTVLGVSVDPVKSHKKFVDKYDLPFILLSDESKQTVKDYEVWAEKKFMGRTYMGIMRWSFLINPEGKITKIYEDVKPSEHVAEVLGDLESLK